MPPLLVDGWVSAGSSDIQARIDNPRDRDLARGIAGEPCRLK